MFLGFDFAARSDVGLLRSTNQDSAYAGPHLLVVADGMGGAAGGDIASSIAVGTLASLDDEAIGQDDALEALKGSIANAHTEIVSRAHNDPELSGLGTTVTALLRSGNTVAMAHIGDSRAYLLRDGTLDQVTTDHSFVQHLVDTGRLSAADAENHPKRSMLLRVLGDIDADIPVDISAREIRAGDRWLLCTDGLSSIVSRPTLSKTLGDVSDVDECADQLVALALAGGAPDNVTCIVADVVDVDKAPKSGTPSTAAQIVGAASSMGKTSPPARARAAKTPAAKAADLTEPPEEDDKPRPRATRWFRARPWALPIGASAIVFLGTFFAYTWTQSQYYVGEQDGAIAIFRGIPQSLGPFHFSSLVTDETGLTLDDLEPYERDSVRETIRSSSLEEAWEIVDDLRSSD
ncbi:MAG: serine/threonine-protein phosphatase [Demequinaceae bacterium]|nr:serine/threonine-protein phosphatase [Demequinaceae bacterium]